MGRLRNQRIPKAAITSLALTSFLRADTHLVEPLSTVVQVHEQTDILQAPTNPQPSKIHLGVEDPTPFNSIYTKSERFRMAASWYRTAQRILALGIADRVNINLRKSSCTSGITLPKAKASTAFEVAENLARTRTITLCFQLLSDVDGPNGGITAHDYWAANWEGLLRHEFKHLIDYVQLGVDGFDPQLAVNVIERSRAELRSAGLSSKHQIYAHPNDRATEMLLANSISEIRVLMRALRADPHPEPSFVSLDQNPQISNYQKAASVNPVTVLIFEIYARYIIDNVLFRTKNGIVGLSSTFHANHAALLAEKDALVQNPTWDALYHELFAQAKLAEKEGFEFKQ